MDQHFLCDQMSTVPPVISCFFVFFLLIRHRIELYRRLGAYTTVLFNKPNMGVYVSKNGNQVPNCQLLRTWHF